MKRFGSLILLSLWACGPAAPASLGVAPALPLTQWVRPTRGTGGSGYTDIGNAFIGPQRPFGMIRPGPDTETEFGPGAPFLHCSGYAASDTHVGGFSHTHLHGVGIADEGAISLMPVSVDRLQQGLAVRSKVDKSAELATPGYYRTQLTETPVLVELTATRRTAFHRYTFGGSTPAVLVDVKHAIPSVEIRESQVRWAADRQNVTGQARIVGDYSGRGGGVLVYFAARFDRAATRVGQFKNGQIDWGTLVGDSAGLAEFAEARPLQIAVSISWVSVEGARANLEADVQNGIDFDAVRQASSDAWEHWLQQVQITSRGPADFELFYTALYQASLMPSLASDVDRHYRGPDGAVHEATDFEYFTDFSLWDTYRTLHPWWALVNAPLTRDFSRSLMAMAEQLGRYPRWPLGTVETGGMLGEPAALVLADAAIKGATFDVDHALGLFGDGSKRESGSAYLTRGWVPTDDGSWSTSKTLEYAYADAALDQLKQRATLPVSIDFATRAGSFKNTFDATQGYFVGRAADGTFNRPDVTTWQKEFAEGSARQYLWFVPHDVEGLATLVGGRDTLHTRLTEFFAQSAKEEKTLLPPFWYWQGNEPDIHAPWMFAALGDWPASAHWVHWARRQNYGIGVKGLPGNDDSGTLSAWYLFSALGLYPVAGTPHYWLASPALNSAVVTRLRADGSTVTLNIQAPQADGQQVIAVTSLTLQQPGQRDRSITTPMLDQGDLESATLRFAMQPETAP